MGYQVFVARDGQEAIDLLDSETPQLVILDIMMPNVDGFETLAFIKSQQKLKNTKVLFLSAKNKTEDIQKGIDNGADAYITKPFSMKKLTDLVTQLTN